MQIVTIMQRYQGNRFTTAFAMEVSQLCLPFKLKQQMDAVYSCDVIHALARSTKAYKNPPESSSTHLWVI